MGTVGSIVSAGVGIVSQNRAAKKQRAGLRAGRAVLGEGLDEAAAFREQIMADDEIFREAARDLLPILRGEVTGQQRDLPPIKATQSYRDANRLLSDSAEASGNTRSGALLAAQAELASRETDSRFFKGSELLGQVLSESQGNRNLALGSLDLESRLRGDIAGSHQSEGAVNAAREVANGNTIIQGIKDIEAKAMGGMGMAAGGGVGLGGGGGSALAPSGSAQTLGLPRLRGTDDLAINIPRNLNFG